MIAKLVPGTDTHALFSFILNEQGGFADASASAAEDSFRASQPYRPLTKLFIARKLLSSSSGGGSSGGGNLPPTAALTAWLTEALSLRFDDNRVADEEDGEPSSSAGPAPSPPPPPPFASPSRGLTALLTDAVDRSREGITTYLNAGVFAEEHPVVLAAMAASPAGLAAVLLAGTLPDVEPAQQLALLARCLNSSFVSERQLASRIFCAVAPHLTRRQLAALPAAVSGAATSLSPHYGTAVLACLAPPPGADFRTDPASLKAYLEDATDALSRLPPAFNAARLVVAYHRLKAWREGLGGAAPTMTAGRELLQSGGVMRGLLETYLSTPRLWCDWNLPGKLASDRGGDQTGAVRVVQCVSEPGVTALAVPPPGVEEDVALVRWALTAVFAAGEDVLAHLPPSSSSSPSTSSSHVEGGASGGGAAGWTSALASLITGGGGSGDPLDAPLSPWKKWVHPDILRGIQAEARLLRGSEADRAAAGAWSQRLVPANDTSGTAAAAALQRLNDRVVLALCPQMREYLRVDSPVALLLEVKNVPRVEIRIFEVATTAF